MSSSTNVSSASTRTTGASVSGGHSCHRATRQDAHAIALAAAPAQRSSSPVESAATGAIIGSRQTTSSVVGREDLRVAVAARPLDRDLAPAARDREARVLGDREVVVEHAVAERRALGAAPASRSPVGQPALVEREPVARRAASSSHSARGTPGSESHGCQPKASGTSSSPVGLDASS